MRKSILLACSFVAMLETAFVVSVFWSWFIAQPLEVPAISFLGAIGLLLLVSIIRKYVSDRTVDEFDKIINNMTLMDGALDITYPPFCLLIGAVVHCLM